MAEPNNTHTDRRRPFRVPLRCLHGPSNNPLVWMGGRLPRQEWLGRYQERLIAVAGLTTEQARQASEAESFYVLSEGFEDDPEGAADEEISYWDGD